MTVRHPLPGPSGLLEQIRATRSVAELVELCNGEHAAITSSMILGNAAKRHRESLRA